MLWILLASGKSSLLEIIKHRLIRHVKRPHQGSGITDHHFRVKVFIEPHKNFFAKVLLYFSRTANDTYVLCCAFPDSRDPAKRDIYHRHTDGIPERNHNPKPFSLAFHPGCDSIYKVESSWL
jgi:hypothetical protein